MKNPSPWTLGSLALAAAGSLAVAQRHAEGTEPERTWKAEIGKPAPDFTLRDLNGREVKLSALRGKPVVLEWFNPLCPFVVGAHTGQGTLVDLPEKVMGDVSWLAINSGAPGLPGHGKDLNAEKAAEWNMEYPVLLDESGWVGRAYDAKTTPHMFVLDAKGNLAYAGALDNSQEGGAQPVNYVEQALRAVMSGEPVKNPRTKPYGCGVKYAARADLGLAAPDFTLNDLDGEPVALADHRGHVTVLEWFNPECPIVQKAHGEGGVLANAAERWSEKGVRWLTINSGAEGKQGAGERVNRAAAERWKLTHAILLDTEGTVGKAFGATTTPHMFVLDQRGVLRYVGGHDDGEGTSYVDQALRELLAGKEVSEPKTRNYGCGVKY